MEHTSRASIRSSITSAISQADRVAHTGFESMKPVPSAPAAANVWLGRFAFATSAVTFFLIFVGGLVKSHEAGLSVPDWPNSFGWNMFTFPVKMWVGNIFYEHTHRLLASFTGLLILVQAVWLQTAERRTWVKRLGWAALAGVIVQGVLGGLTVLYYLPTAISSSHAGLAQAVFCATLIIAAATSRHWVENPVRIPNAADSDTGARTDLRKLAVWTVAAIYLQLLVGAVMRHEEAGLAIRTFPLAEDGSIIPDLSQWPIAINFAHRVGAMIVSALVIWTVSVALRSYRELKSFSRPARFAIVALLLQVTLGAITVWTSKAETPTTLHVSGGAMLLGTMFLLAVRARHLIATPGIGSKLNR